MYSVLLPETKTSSTVRPIQASGTGALPPTSRSLCLVLLSVPLLNTLPAYVLLPLLRPLVAVRPVPQLLKLPTGLRPEDSLERIFEGFPGPFGAIPRLALQNLLRHVSHPLVILRIAGSFRGARPLWWVMVLLFPALYSPKCLELDFSHLAV